MINSKSLFNPLKSIEHARAYMAGVYKNDGNNNDWRQRQERIKSADVECETPCVQYVCTSICLFSIVKTISFGHHVHEEKSKECRRMSRRLKLHNVPSSCVYFLHGDTTTV
ncbi:uncharacterized protein LOC112692966 [Sipha flava]|nr:uncharacterized protein LOC112692966 [Sipha flava]